MDAARITAIADGVTVQARAAAEGDVSAGAWRTIAENGIVNHREELLVESDSAKYGFAACKIQKRVASAWTDALTIELDLPSGTSHMRKDRLSVVGTATNSSVAVTTIAKGDRDLVEALRQLKAYARSRFTLEDDTTKFRAITDALEFANQAEMGGFQQEFNGILLADREQFEEAEVTPERGNLLILNGVSYRIVSVKVDEISYELTVNSVNR